MQTETTPFNLKAEWSTLWARRYVLLGAGVAAALVAYIATLPFLYKPEYLSTASFIPPVLGQTAQARNTFKTGIEFGLDKDIEQMAGTLTSDTAMMYLVNRFKLIDHYGVREENEKRQYRRLRAAYEDNVLVELSRYSTVVVKVYDVDPALAADMANALVAYADSFVERTAGRKAYISAMETAIKEVDQRRQFLQDTLGKLRAQYGVYNFRYMAEGPSNTALQRMGGNAAFHKKYDQIFTWESELETINKELADLRVDYLVQKRTLEAKPSLISVVGYAVRAHYPTRPQKGLIVFSVTLGTVLLTMLGILLYERRHAVRAA